MFCLPTIPIVSAGVGREARRLARYGTATVLTAGGREDDSEAREGPRRGPGGGQEGARRGQGRVQERVRRGPRWGQGPTSTPCRKRASLLGRGSSRGCRFGSLTGKRSPGLVRG
eukprot:769396-Prorocentrum_minimum.AAC.1